MPLIFFFVCWRLDNSLWKPVLCPLSSVLCEPPSLFLPDCHSIPVLVPLWLFQGSMKRRWWQKSSSLSILASQILPSTHRLLDHFLRHAFLSVMASTELEETRRVLTLQLHKFVSLLSPLCLAIPRSFDFSCCSFLVLVCHTGNLWWREIHLTFRHVESFLV